jgi:rare lipoprotein A
MGFVRGSCRFARSSSIARVAAIAATAIILANCSGGMNGVDPKYGVSASKRVIEPGQPVPKGGGVYRVGKPYVVAGRTYTPEENINYSAEGIASWYGDDFHGRYTANGEVFDMNSISAAHPTLPLPSYARVTNLKNHKSIIVRITDRGPYANDRIIDLSVRTAQLLGFYGHGLARVKVDYVGRAPLAGSDDRKLVATLRDGDQPSRDKTREVQLAAAGNFAPAYFDKMPMSKAATFHNVPSPPDRPATADDDNDPAEAAPVRPTRVAQATQGPTFNQRFGSVEQAPLDPPPSTGQPGRLTSPVSAYAPVRYDPAAGFMGGRGLY